PECEEGDEEVALAEPEQKGSHRHRNVRTGGDQESSQGEYGQVSRNRQRRRTRPPPARDQSPNQRAGSVGRDGQRGEGGSNRAASAADEDKADDHAVADRSVQGP